MKTEHYTLSYKALTGCAALGWRLDHHGGLLGCGDRPDACSCSTCHAEVAPLSRRPTCSLQADVVHSPGAAICDAGQWWHGEATAGDMIAPVTCRSRAVRLHAVAGSCLPCNT